MLLPVTVCEEQVIYSDTVDADIITGVVPLIFKYEFSSKFIKTLAVGYVVVDCDEFLSILSFHVFN
jgi:hypothetical protein